MCMYGGCVYVQRPIALICSLFCTINAVMHGQLPETSGSLLCGKQEANEGSGFSQVAVYVAL